MNELNRKYLILDLDGVLITTSPWKADEIAADGYSEFNAKCVQNLNSLLQEYKFEIWLSSTRRTVKTVDEFNTIFQNRNIINSISGFLPKCEECNSRKEEVEKFILENELSDYLILDDDKSLNALPSNMKHKLVSTELLKGFTTERLEYALSILKKE